MVRCPRCGKDNPDKQRFCFWCETPLPTQEISAHEKPSPPAERVRYPPPRKKGLPGRLAAGVVLGVSLVILVGMVVYFLWGKTGPIRSYQCMVDQTIMGQTWTMRAVGKNLDSSNPPLRVDVLSGSGAGTAFILRVGEGKAYTNISGAWAEAQMDQSFVQQYQANLQEYQNQISKWTGGEITFEFYGITTKVYDIKLNPSLADSLFMPS